AARRRDHAARHRPRAGARGIPRRPAARRWRSALEYRGAAAARAHPRRDEGWRLPPRAPGASRTAPLQPVGRVMATRFVERMAVEVDGEGDAVLMLHGLGGTSNTW